MTSIDAIQALLLGQAAPAAAGEQMQTTLGSPR